MAWFDYLKVWKWPEYAMTWLRGYQELKEARAKRLKAEAELAAFQESRVKTNKEAEHDELIRQCALVLQRYAKECKRKNLNDRYFREQRLADQLGENSVLLPEVLNYMRKEGQAKLSEIATTMWEID